MINIFVTRALFKLLNEEEKDRKDKALLALQAGIRLIFCTSASIALAKKRGIPFAANYLPLLDWTWFAGTLAEYQAFENRDPIFGDGVSELI